MGKRFLASFAVIMLISCGATAAQEDTTSEASRRAAWQRELESKEFWFPDDAFGMAESLYQVDSACAVTIVSPARPGKQRGEALEFRFAREEGATISVKGHLGSSFVSIGDRLFFAEFWSDVSGCHVSGYDLTTGERLWRSELKHAKPAGASGYANRVRIRQTYGDEGEGETDGSAIMITGRESYCDYVAVLDAATGEELALKNYRVGFGRLAEEAPDEGADAE